MKWKMWEKTSVIYFYVCGVVGVVFMFSFCFLFCCLNLFLLYFFYFHSVLFYSIHFDLLHSLWKIFHMNNKEILTEWNQFLVDESVIYSYLFRHFIILLRFAKKDFSFIYLFHSSVIWWASSFFTHSLTLSLPHSFFPFLYIYMYIMVFKNLSINDHNLPSPYIVTVHIHTDSYFYIGLPNQHKIYYPKK